jgi:hypothetical protein
MLNGLVVTSTRRQGGGEGNNQRGSARGVRGRGRVGFPKGGERGG